MFNLWEKVWSKGGVVSVAVRKSHISVAAVYRVCCSMCVCVCMYNINQILLLRAVNHTLQRLRGAEAVCHQRDAQSRIKFKLVQSVACAGHFNRCKKKKKEEEKKQFRCCGPHKQWLKVPLKLWGFSLSASPSAAGGTWVV